MYVGDDEARGFPLSVAQIFTSSSSLRLKKPKTLVDTSCYHAVITTKFPMNRIAIGRTVEYGEVQVC